MTSNTELLAATPPAETLQWVRRQIGGDVVGVEPLVGGTSHANHVVRLATRRGEVEVVLRRWVRPDWAATDPEFSPDQEIATYGLLAAGVGVPAPSLLAADPGGAFCDVPALLLSRAAGRPFAGTATSESLGQLAAILPALHSADPAGARSRLAPYRPYYEPDRLRPPTWAGSPAVWARAIEIATGPAPATTAAFIHRDYHQGNTLWLSGRLSAVVDWTSASYGPPEVDVAHMRANLAMSFGCDVADEFRHHYVEAGGPAAFDPYWDLRDAVDFLPELTSGERSNLELVRLEEFVARAVASR